MIAKLIGIAVAGGVGTLARYGLSGLVQQYCAAGSSGWGTLVVNVVGCFLFGLIWTMTESVLGGAADLRLYVLTGFMGAFTTFSTLHFETGQMLRDSQWVAAAGNLMGQNALGICMLLAGMAMGKAF